MNTDIMDFFAFEHLPPDLQNVSRPFGELAGNIVDSLAPCAERTVALRKLLESKDAAVRTFVAMKKEAMAAQQSDDRKPGLNDMPADQQQQLDEGRSIEPAPAGRELGEGEGARGEGIAVPREGEVEQETDRTQTAFEAGEVARGEAAQPDLAATEAQQDAANMAFDRIQQEEAPQPGQARPSEPPGGGARG